MKKIYIVIFSVLIIPVLVSTVNAQTLHVDVHVGDLKDIEESKYKASGVTITRNAEGELISVVKVDASRYLDHPIIVLVAGTSFIPNKGSHTQNIPPITSVNDNKVNSAAGIAFDPIEYKINPRQTNVP